MYKVILFFIFLALTAESVFTQTDVTPETKFSLSGSRSVSGDENRFSSYSETPVIPQNLLQNYNIAEDSKNEMLKIQFNNEIEKYLNKSSVKNTGEGIGIISGEQVPFTGDWYNSDVQVTGSDVAYAGGYRQMDLKYGEDGWMYLAVNRRNIANYNGSITVYRSSNGGATWGIVSTVYSQNGYYGSFSMLVESRDNSIPDSTRILIYSTHSYNVNFNDADVYLASFRRNGSSAYIVNVASPSAGNRFVNVSACSDGMFYQGVTFMHAVVREETNGGVYAGLKHFRTTNWGEIHTVGIINTFSEDRYPVCGFSSETGPDSIYVAVEREISPNEREIRLIALSSVPNNDYRVRYITDAASGTIYERPSITIQQRHSSVPQRILVTCTKNDRAVYHYSEDGGAEWNIDYGLGIITQAVDYTSCSSDSLAAGGEDFIAAFVDLNGDSVTVRHGQPGSMGVMQQKKNSFASTGTLAPVCAIYKNGSEKLSAFSYAGLGPTSVYYNMETLVTGIHQTNSEVPARFSLEQNYPNPFNPVTNIKFSIPKAGFVTLKIYDISGREVAQLVNRNISAGTFNYDFDASGLSTGVYFYRINADGFTDVKKMMLIK
jgi:hypothetical protein